MIVEVCKNKGGSVDISFDLLIFSRPRGGSLVEFDEAMKIAKDAKVVRFHAGIGRSGFRGEIRATERDFEANVESAFAQIKEMWVELEKFVATCHRMALEKGYGDCIG